VAQHLAGFRVQIFLFQRHLSLFLHRSQNLLLM
jgi:hypothetical protein